MFCRTRSTPMLVPLVAVAFAAVRPGPATAQLVFHADFNAAVPPEVSAPGSQLDGVSGWAGLGPTGRTFSGSFLRYTAVSLFPTTLTLSGLPPHDHVDIRFLLAVIDSWDGTELLEISVDGGQVFSHWFQLATGDTSSYQAPPGALLSSGTDLGFSGSTWYLHDRAYDLGAEPAFLSVPHTASTLQVVWSLGAVSGPAANQWQGGSDESWAIDELTVEVSSLAVNAPAAAAASGLVLAGAWPNPSGAGRLPVHFTLPPGVGAATLDLVDVSGRVVESRAVGSLGAGGHRMELSGGRRLPAGVYFLRLAHGNDVRVQRAVVVN